MSRLPRFRALRIFIVFASALAVTLSVAIWLRTANAEGATPSAQQYLASPYHPAPLAKTHRQTALFVGDDFTAGYGGIGRNAYPRIVCNGMRMNCNVDAQVGTGLVSDGREYSSNTFRMIDRLRNDQKLYDADVVIVDAGRNDIEVDPIVYGDALDQYLRRVTEIWPGAAIVVIAPSYVSSEPYADYDTRISVIRNVVQSFEGSLIDPIAEGWFDDADVSTLLLPDHFHPNQAGHQFIATKLEESLRSRGIGVKGR
jgi:lysophospholipase L1-like esterase